MILKLYIQNSNTGIIYDITNLASNIEITKSIDGTAGKFSCLLQKDINNILTIANGSIVSFLVDGKGIFYGYVFTIGTDASQTYKLTAYDQMRYLKNEEVYVTADMTASDIFAKVCEDNELRYLIKSPTSYIPSAYLHDKKTLYSIIERGMNYAKLFDKKQYYILDDFGTLVWSDLSLEKTNLILGDKSLVTGYQYEKSIDKETYNQIKMYRQNKKTGRRDVWIVKDSDNIKRWGKLQYVEKVDENDTEAMITQTLNNYLKLKNRETKTLRITALGVDELVAGKGFRFVLNYENINEDMWIVSSKHYYEKDSHIMDLEVYI